MDFYFTLMIACILGYAMAMQTETEPTCLSRFDYDVKLLESYLELKQSYMQLSDTVEKLRETVDRQKTDVADNSPQSMSPKVAFYVQLTADARNLGDHQTIKFDLITTNIGNGYNPVDGVFTANVAGTHVFSWTNTNKDRSYMNTELMKNDKVFGKAMSDAMDHSDYAVASNTAILDLEAGDKVWIRSGTWHSRTVAGSQYTTFAGWLLYST